MDRSPATAQLVRRFNKYVAYRRQAQQSKEAFSEKLKEQARLNEPSKHAAPQLAQPHNISNAQANRLAQYAPLIQDAATKHDVPVELICGVMLQESGCKERAVSPVGARGLMQLMPATAKRFGVKNSFDAAQNIDGGTKYLKFLLKKFSGDIELALAGYNAGEGAVEKYGNKVPPYRETQDYIPKVLGYTQSMIDILSQETMQSLPDHARRA